MSWLFSSIINVVLAFRAHADGWFERLSSQLSLITRGQEHIMQELDTLKTEVGRLSTEVAETKALVAAQAEIVRTQSLKIEELLAQLGDQPTLKAELENIAASIKSAADELDALQPKPVPSE